VPASVIYGTVVGGFMFGFVRFVAKAAMPNGRCKVHGGKSTGPRTPEGRERSRRANWKHGHFSRGAKGERSLVRAAILALRYLCMLGH
jgi:hypothetical protein